MVLKFKDYLNESYVNLIGDDERKVQYADQVWDILQQSYSKIGGIKGNGFKSKEDMIKNIPFWKMDVYNGNVTAVVLYKDKNGRKSVASGTDGSNRGGDKIREIIKNELTRSYGEKSKRALGLVLKLYPFDVIKNYLKTPQEVQKILSDDKIIPISQYKGKLDSDDEFTLNKYPYIKQYAYIRELGGKMAMKVMIGTTNKTIQK